MPVQSVRVRTTAGASVVVLVALAFGGVLLLNIMRDSQTRAVDNALELRAVDIESLLAGGAAPATVAVSDDDSFVQIVDDDGLLASAGDTLADVPPLTGVTVETTTTERIATLDDEQFRVHAHPIDGAHRLTVIVGTTLEHLERNQFTLTRALVFGIPVLVAVIAALVWVAVGRALRPVEAIRARVADIGAPQLDQRVPVPPTHDEIGRLASTMNEMLDRLQDADTRQARFVSDASHELRTPLAVIRHALEIALREDGNENWRDTARDVLDEDLRMQRLVDDLLFMARHEQRTSRRALSAGSLVDLDDIVMDEVRRRPTAVSIDVSGISAGQVHGHAEHLGRVVRNLLDNAIQHATTSVAVHVSSESGHVVVDVDDDGAGVLVEHQEHIFERFGRVDGARTRDDGGTGLGLAIVREIVNDHGGTVTVRRSPTLGGARFSITLPNARTTTSR